MLPKILPEKGASQLRQRENGDLINFGFGKRHPCPRPCGNLKLLPVNRTVAAALLVAVSQTSVLAASRTSRRPISLETSRCSITIDRHAHLMKIISKDGQHQELSPPEFSNDDQWVSWSRSAAGDREFVEFKILSGARGTSELARALYWVVYEVKNCRLIELGTDNIDMTREVEEPPPRLPRTRIRLGSDKCVELVVNGYVVLREPRCRRP